MIKNEREYRITKAQAAELEHALTDLTSATREPELHLLLQQAQREALVSQLEDLREEIAEYEALQKGSTTVIEVNSFGELPTALIKARIAAGLTQRDLAERLGIKEQQVQRYEATDYASASLSRLNEVVQALGLRVRNNLLLPNAHVSLSDMLLRLRKAGIDQELLVGRLVPRELAAQLESPVQSEHEDTNRALLLAQS